MTPGRRPQPGDWVRLRRSFPANWYDVVSGGGLPAGALGVVTSRSGRTLTVTFDTGFGSATTTVPDRACRVVRRGAGVARFQRRMGTRALIRTGVAAALLLPLVVYAGEYVLKQRGTEGLAASLASAVVHSAVESVTAAIENPLRAGIYATVVAALSRFAFGRR